MIRRRTFLEVMAAIGPLAGPLILDACSGGGSTVAVPAAGTRGVQVVQQQPPSQVLKFPLLTSSSGPSAVALGADANYWVTEGSAGKIARVTNAGAVTEFAYVLSRAPSFVATGGGAPYAVWSVDSKDAILGAVSPAGVPAEVALPAGSSPQEVYDDASGDVWFAEAGLNVVAETTNAIFNKKPPKLTSYALPAGSHPFSIVQGPDKNIWVTEPGSGAIAKIPHAGGAVTQYALPSGRTPTTIVNTGGYLWFGESSSSGAAYLARMTTAGVLTEYASPGNAIPEFLAAGPLSAVWYSTSASQLAYAVIGTKVAFHAAVANLAGLVPIVRGKDNNIWYPDSANDSLDVYVVYPMTVTSSSIVFTAVAQTQTFTVSETHFTGNFSASSSNASVASISPSSGNVFTVTANAAGTATITVSDSPSYPASGNGTTISISVTTTGISIN